MKFTRQIKLHLVVNVSDFKGVHIFVYQVNLPLFLMKQWPYENKWLLSTYLKQTSCNLTSYGDSTSFKNATKVGTEK